MTCASASRIAGRGRLLRSLRALLGRVNRYAVHRARTNAELRWAARFGDAVEAALSVGLEDAARTTGTSNGGSTRGTHSKGPQADGMTKISNERWVVFCWHWRLSLPLEPAALDVRPRKSWHLSGARRRPHQCPVWPAVNRCRPGSTRALQAPHPNAHRLRRIRTRIPQPVNAAIPLDTGGNIRFFRTHFWTARPVVRVINGSQRSYMGEFLWLEAGVGRGLEGVGSR